ncbi:hypothetical protein DL764_010111 [Monosporascus ibericus]|uniref:Nephrocystin 3-like N-terminal domain-containing protein n=1 Tax=Monosporascus ibericus TaxID=155417 RepID=A0A4Q4STE0_9PEZI|nr:hypothetical protein DL764_010111 [Monosporascus ibericus]
MLRSILYQLLREDDALYKRFAPLFRDKQEKHKKWGWEWQQSQLKEFMLSEIQKWQSKPPLLLIDALNECNEEDVRAVVEFLERLSINTFDARITLSVCLSSRHYPNIRMERNLELTLETSKDHGEDIDTYVRETLTLDDKIDLNIRRKIETEIRQKASGIFMWVMLVVAILNQAYDDGRLKATQKRLNQVPSSLEGLFSTLLNQKDLNKAETILMLQWVLFSQRPLKPEELVATVAEAVPENLERFNRSIFTSENVQKRITSSSKGLIEVRKGWVASVQFIHQSVHDFLLRNKRLQTLDQTLEPDLVSASHARLWACCRSYIEQVDTTLTSEEHIRELNDNYPFLKYAASHIFDHAEKALLGGADVNAQGGYYGNALRAAAKRHQKIVKVLVDKGADLNAQSGYYGNMLEAASYEGHEDIVRILLEKGADINAQGGEYGNILQAASNGGYEKSANVNAQGGKYSNALQAASYQGHEEIVRILLKKGADAQGSRYGNILQAASAGGKADRALLSNASTAPSSEVPLSAEVTSYHRPAQEPSTVPTSLPSTSMAADPQIGNDTVSEEPKTI